MFLSAPNNIIFSFYLSYNFQMTYEVLFDYFRHLRTHWQAAKEQNLEKLQNLVVKDLVAYKNH